MLPAFDIPAGVSIEADGWGSWQPCHLNGAVIAFDRNNETVPRAREVRVTCGPDEPSQTEAVKITHKLRQMGWRNCTIEVI